MAIDAPPPSAGERLARPRRAVDAGEALADRIIAMQRRGARPRPERKTAPLPPKPADIVVEPPSPVAERTVASPVVVAAPSPSPPGQTVELPKVDKLPRGQLRRPPPKDAEYDRGPPVQPRAAPSPSRAAAGRGRGELFNPSLPTATQPAAPVRHLHVEEGTGSDHSSGSMPRRQAAGMSSQRQLFDPGRHDPVRFSATPNQSSSNGRGRRAGMVAYTPSNSSQSSVTDTSSLIEASSGQGTEASEPPPPRTNPIAETLRRAYKRISDLEVKCAKEAEAEQRGREDRPDEWTREELAPVEVDGPQRDDRYWLNAIELHKELADAYHAFLDLACDTRLPASMQTLPQKYNIPTKLWQHAIFPMLQRLRRAQTTSASPSPPSPTDGPDILGHLTEFIYYAYVFYTSLLEERLFAAFRSAWLEQLGDLARFRMAVAATVARAQQASDALTAREAKLTLPGRVSPDTRIDDDDVQSDTRGSDNSYSLDAWDLEEQETWRAVSRDWYAKGLAETPGTGRLHHHLGLLAKADDFRALYHFTRSLTASHPYFSARESIRPTLEATEDRARRVRPDATSLDMFVHLHSMLFTRIGLDDFEEVLARFEERLRQQFLLLTRAQAEGQAFKVIGPARWTMMAVVNVAALLQYGVDESLLRRAMTKKEVRETVQEDKPQAIMLAPSNEATGPKANSDAGSDVGSTSPLINEGMRILSLASIEPEQGVDPPLTFTLAQRLSFSLFSFSVAHFMPPLKDSGRSPNPYLIVMLTFLYHLVQHQPALELIERQVPWLALVDLFNRIPRVALNGLSHFDPPAKLSGTAPLPEDWCIRGMEWTGRHVFGRGYWKPTTSGRRDGSPQMPTPESEVDVLETEFDPAIAASVAGLIDVDATQANQRWKRIAIAALWIAKMVPGFDYEPQSARFAVSGILLAKVRKWKAEDEAARKRLAKERAAKEVPTPAAIAAAEEEDEEDLEEDNEDREDDSEEVKQLKARRRELRAIIRDARARVKIQQSARVPARQKGPAPLKTKPAARSALQAVAGYTILVFDTNILLNSLRLFSSLLESCSWTIVVPLAVITELDGLTKASAEIASHARSALTYLESHVKSHGLYLKVQTSKGNYLGDLAIRNETIDFAGDGTRTMDDVILRAASWQTEHFVDRSYTLSMASGKAPAIEASRKEAAVRVALVTFDRNLRVKARARGIDAAGDTDLARLVLQTQAKLDKG